MKLKDILLTIILCGTAGWLFAYYLGGEFLRAYLP